MGAGEYDPSCTLCGRDPGLRRLCASCAEVLGKHPGRIPALVALRAQVPGLELPDALQVIAEAGLFPPPPLVEPELEELLGLLGAVRSKVEAIEAGWDGDSHGWLVWLSAVASSGDIPLATLQHPTGDLRIFHGRPIRAEAEMAERVGKRLADALNVPFWFPAVGAPNEEAARYHERNDALPCRTCGLPLAPGSKAAVKRTCGDCAR